MKQVIENCHWCNKKLKKCKTEVCTSYCRYCKLCDAHLPDETENYFFFRKIIGGRKYYLDLFFDSNCSELVYIDDYHDAGGSIEMKFDFIIDVKPENVVQKIKNILLFQ